MCHFYCCVLSPPHTELKIIFAFFTEYLIAAFSVSFIFEIYIQKHSFELLLCRRLFFITYYYYYRRRRIIFWVGDPILKKHDEILQILRFLILKISESRDARPLQFWCPWLLLYFDDRHSHSWNSVIWYDKEKKIFYWSVQFTCQTARRQIDFIILCKYIWFLL